MEEDEVLEMLNENLRMELIIHLNGKMLHDQEMFKYFSISFLRELTFSLKSRRYGIGDIIFNEDEIGNCMHYLTKGLVILEHKRSATFIAEVGVDSFLGEVSFFTGRPRTTTAKSRYFTEVLTL